MRDPEYARKQIAFYKLQRTQAVETIRLIDTGKVAFHETRGAQRALDVTAQRRLEIESQISLYDELIHLWGRDLPGSKRRPTPPIIELEPAAPEDELDPSLAYQAAESTRSPD